MDYYFVAVVSLSFELPPTDSFLSFSAPEFFLPVGISYDAGAGFWETDDEALDSDGVAFYRGSCETNWACITIP